MKFDKSKIMPSVLALFFGGLMAYYIFNSIATESLNLIGILFTGLLSLYFAMQAFKGKPAPEATSTSPQPIGVSPLLRALSLVVGLIALAAAIPSSAQPIIVVIGYLVIATGVFIPHLLTQRVSCGLMFFFGIAVLL